MDTGNFPDSRRDAESSVLRDIIDAQLKEQRRQRRWKIFFRLAVLAVIIGALASAQFTHGPMERAAEHTAMVKLEGIILAGAPASASNIAEVLASAFENQKSKGVILHVNSPGGSAVQAAEINRTIRELRKTHNKPIYAVVSDICASGAYYAAVATDAIYVDKSSLVGSIGVIYSGFGFTDLLTKMGVERRTVTAGKHKNMLDPFSPQKAEDKEHLQELLNRMHQNFIAAVRTGRGAKLSGDEDVFSGLIWTGDNSIALGLTDAIGSADYVAREIIGAEKIVEYEVEMPLINKLAEQVSARLKHAILEQTMITTPY